jgi:hypothetical protein
LRHAWKGRVAPILARDRAERNPEGCPATREL